MKNYYDILGVGEDASNEQIKKALTNPKILTFRNFKFPKSNNIRVQSMGKIKSRSRKDKYNNPFKTVDNKYFVAAYSYKYDNDIDKKNCVVLKLCFHYQLYIISQQDN